MNHEGPNAQKTEEQLFEEMSKAIKDGDDLALNKLMKDEPLEEPAQPAEPTPPEPQPAQVEAPTPTAVSPAPEDWEAGLNEEVKERVKALKEERDNLDRRVKSELGRVPYLQRELANNKRELEELKRKLQEPPKRVDTPAAPAPKQGKIAEKLAQLREVDPVLADIFEAMQDEVINPLREDLGNEINQVKSVFASKEEEALWVTEKNKLLERFPQADEIFKLPLYREWKDTLTPSQRALASSIYADDVSVALEQFARYASVHHPELVAQPEPAKPAATPTPSASAAKLVEDRNKKLAARPPGSAAPTPKFGDGLPETEEELHEYFRKKIRAGEM